MAYSYNGKTSSTNTAIRRYIKIQLTMVAGSGGASWEARDLSSAGSHPNGYADGSTEGDTGTTGNWGRVLQDAIPFNYDPAGSYNVAIYRDNSGQAGTTIPFGSSGGDWNLDIEAGVVTFYQYSTVSSFVDENKPIYISFYRYVGQKGLATNTQVNTFTGGDETTENPLTSDDLKAVQIGNQMEFLAGEGINTIASGNTLQIAGELASTSNIGVAKFTSDNFDVTSGDVSIITVDGGSF